MIGFSKVTEFAVNRIKALNKLASIRPVANQPLYGENYFWFYERKQPNGGYRSCRDAVNMWYDGIKDYNFQRPGFKDKTGGFTQLVWRGSEFVGCAMVQDDEKDRDYYQTFIVCNYWPPGNVGEQYGLNVLPKRRPNSSGHGSNNDYDHNSQTNRPVGGGGGIRPIGVGGSRPIDNWSSETSWIGNRPAGGPAPPTYPYSLSQPII